MRKLCTAVLFAFLATIVVAGAAAAFVTTRQHIDYLSLDVDANYKHNLRPAHNVGIEGKLTGFEVEDGQAILRHVSKDNRYIVDDLYYYWPDVYNAHEYPGNTISDKDFLVLYSQDKRTFFNVPTSVVDILYGGNGTVGNNFNKDPNGFTVHKDHANEIVNKLALNPANGPHDKDGAIFSVYMLSVDVSGGLKSFAKDTVVVPVGLNYEYFSSRDRAEYYSVQKGRANIAKASSDVQIVEYTEKGENENVVNYFTSATSKKTDARMLGVGDKPVRPSDDPKVQLYGNSRFTGMRVRDIKLVKVYGNENSGKQIPFEQVYSMEKLEHGKFVVVKSVVSSMKGAKVAIVTDTVLGPDAIITNDAPHRILYAVRDGVDNFDFTTPHSNGPMVDPVLVYAEYPFVKDPAIKGDGAFHNTVETVVGWGRIASLRGPGFNAYDPDAKSVAAYPEEDKAQDEHHNDYTALLRDTFDLDSSIKRLGSKKDNMVWLKDSVITDQYGFDLDNVHQFPMTLGDLSARQNTGVIVFSIREPEKFVGRRVSDVRVINATGKDFASPQEYRFVDNKTDMVDGTFAVLQRDPAYPTANYTTPFDQVMMAADDEFVEGQAYFIALAAKDGGDFDVQQGRQGIADTKNDRTVHFAAFAVVGSVTPVLPTLVIGPAQSTIEPGEELQLTATRSDTGDDVDVTWESSDDAVLTVEDGLVTGVADGTAVVTATPVAPSDLDPATKTITVQTPQPGGGGSGGGCSVGFAPAAVLLLAPLFVLLKK